MEEIKSLKEFRRELRTRIEIVESLNRHFDRVSQSCDESTSLAIPSPAEEHLSILFSKQESDTYSRLATEIEELYSLIQKGKEKYIYGGK